MDSESHFNVQHISLALVISSIFDHC